MAINKIEATKQYKTSKELLAWESILVTGGAAIFGFNLSLAFEDARPQDMSYSDFQLEYIAEQKEDCSYKTIEKVTERCEQPEQDMIDAYTEMQITLPADIEYFEQNIEPIAEPVSMGLGIAFFVAATCMIIGPRIIETFGLRKKIPDVSPLKVLGVEIEY